MDFRNITHLDPEDQIKILQKIINEHEKRIDRA